MPLIRKPAAAEDSKPDPRQALLEGSTDARWAAARALATPDGVGALSQALAGERDPRVREAILTSLARIDTPEAAAMVAPLIRAEEAAVRTAALDALRAMPLSALPLLADLLADPDPDVRLLTCEIVRALPADKAVPLLLALLAGETQANVCGAAVEVLAELGGPDALPALEACAARFPDEPFLAFAIRAASRRAAERPGWSRE